MNISATVVCLYDAGFRDIQALLVSANPFWRLPERILKDDERVVSAALTVLDDELGIVILPEQLRFVGFYDSIGRYPDRVISLAYYAFFPEKPPIQSPTDISWNDINELPDNIMADHARIIKDCKRQYIRTLST